MRFCGVILSGGKSSRMGTTKSFLEIDDKPVITHITHELKKLSDCVTIITNEPAEYQFLEVDLFQDRFRNKGPLAGIEAAMYHTDADIYLFAACDMPFIHCDVYQHLIQSLQGHQAVIPLYNERMHPLSGIYTKHVLPQIQQLLENDQKKIRTLFDYITVNYVTNYNGIPKHILDKHFFNMNYPEQYELAKRL
ncbi:putative molybdenum cofactor guanylyltransferase [Lentibacillus kapialis]|uniref:Probable molybdenum cofactor guanylyltransferase n=1 Tax=Lentibacillus kapialis TaxID=340214 RepID=A0A917PN06_9BACI|nr:molybdenum cofactor guanylyltransferase [Lentibacillus kapialis]GGJ85297.1 putative molybdenum cofactor guanylyltransferase [Lentibacillus kapialis]